MIKRKKLVIISILFIIFILVGCTQKELNINSITEKNNNTEINEINNEENEDNNLNYEIKTLSQEKTIKNYIYSPDGNNYFIEENYIVYDSGLNGNDGVYKIFLNGNPEELGYQYFVNLERNLSPNSAIWINNEEVFIIDSSLHRYNIRTNKKEKIDLFGDGFGPYTYYGNLNADSTKLTFIMQNGVFRVYIYDIKAEVWEEIYNYKHFGSELNLKSIWGINDYVYFDEIIRTKNENNQEEIKTINNIKKYNVKTKQIDDFKLNSKILNISPNNRYITYIDTITSEIKMIDLLNNIEIELPFSIELAWNKSSSEFVYVESENYIVRNKIEDGNIQKTEKYDISNLIRNEGDTIFNLQYVNNKLWFDIVNFKSDPIYFPIENTFYNGTSAGINEVTTYEIIEK